MKKIYSISLALLLALSSIYVTAADIEPTSNPEPDSSDIIATQEVPEIIDNADESHTEDSEELAPTPTPSTISEEETGELEEEQQNASDNEGENEDEKNEEDEETSEEQEEEEHEHVFIYVSNGDGTHIKKCEECDDFEEVTEECTFEDGKCIYCQYEEPGEPEFNPSISVEISNQNCVIGSSNPVISLALSDENFDIAYAQICFANYTKNQFINIGLSQGKYYDPDTGEFVSTSDNKWYASPEITDDYDSGELTIRSLFVRSTTGEFVHYSLESDNLNPYFETVGITLRQEGEEIVEQEPIEDLEAERAVGPVITTPIPTPTPTPTPKPTATPTPTPKPTATPTPTPKPTATPTPTPKPTATPTPTPKLAKNPVVTPTPEVSKGADKPVESDKQGVGSGSNSSKATESKQTTQSNTNNNSNTNNDTNQNYVSQIVNFFKSLFGFK